MVPMACVSFGTYELVRGAMVRAEEGGGIRALLPRSRGCRRPFAPLLLLHAPAAAAAAETPAVAAASAEAPVAAAAAAPPTAVAGEPRRQR